MGKRRMQTLVADTYQARTCGYGCRGGRHITDYSLIETAVISRISGHCGDAVRAQSLYREARADHRGRLEVQVHVPAEGGQAVVQGHRQGPSAAMASSADVMTQV